MDDTDTPTPTTVPNEAAAPPSAEQHPPDPSLMTQPTSVQLATFQPAELSPDASPPPTAIKKDTTKGKAIAVEPSTQKSRLRAANRP